jgi:peptidoglycan/xylan/chitin deacetylase (PgdA/CDA1 family)
MAAPSAILTYHSLDGSGSVVSFPPTRFADDMSRIADAGVPVVPLTEIASRSGAIAITFDDAYENFARYAWPVLNQLKFPVTLFVVTGHTGGTNQWDEGNPRIPRQPLLDWTALRGLAREGVDLGAHSHTHPDLTKCSASELRHQIDSSFSAIEAETGVRPASFAFPYGRSNPTVRMQAAARFAICCGTRLDYCRGGENPTNLPRIDTHYLQGRVTAPSVLAPGARAWIKFRRMIRLLGARSGDLD